MFCKKCGAQNPDAAVFCKKCGTRFSEKPQSPVTKVAKVPVNAKESGTRKRRPIFTTRKTSKSYLVWELTSDVVPAVFAVFMFEKADKLIRSYWYKNEGQTLQTVGFLLIFFAILSAIYHVMVSRTYADLFENRISGSGMQKIQAKSFDLKFDQIVGISVSKGFMNIEAGNGAFLIINTSAGDYKVVTTAARAKEIAEYYSNATHQHISHRER